MTTSLRCSRDCTAACGGCWPGGARYPRRIVGAVTEPHAVRRLLAALGLAAEPPPRRGGHPNLEVRRHDIISDDLPSDAFDLVHTRLLLKHLPDRERALVNMVGGLRPGGWLVAEDTDWSSAGVDPCQSAFTEALAALRGLTEATGGVPDYGRALPEALAAAGLAEVGSSRASHRLRCGTPEVEFFRLTFEQVRERAVAGGLIASRRLDAALDALDAPGGAATSFTMVTAWGRKAGTGRVRPRGEWSSAGTRRVG